MLEKISKNQKVKLIGSFISTTLLGLFVVLVIFVYLNSTYGWFSNNREVNGRGMSVQAEVSPNLVLSDSATTISGYTESGWNDSYFEKVWNESPLELIPTDHYDSTVYSDSIVDDGTNVFNLVYNSNPENVARGTGKGVDLRFAHVPSDGEDLFFIDRVIYIASLSREMTQGRDYSVLTFSIEEAGTGTTTNSAYKSASVDVYVNEVFKGTLNLDTLDSFSISDITSIPLNTSGSIKITFRCYFDGALNVAGNTGKNYVNSTDLAVNTANIFIDLYVKAE